MEISIKPEISHVRIYEEGLTYENKDPFLFIVTVHHLGDDEVYLSGAQGKVNRTIIKELRKYLGDRGIKTIRFEKVKNNRVVSKRFFTW